MLIPFLHKRLSRDKPGESSTQGEHDTPPSGSRRFEGTSRYERLCYDELVRAGARPVMPSDILKTVTDINFPHGDLLAPWLDDTWSDIRDGEVPPVFSAQLDDWETFKHKWQWDHRGKYKGKEGFAGFIESQRKKRLREGKPKGLSEPSLEEMRRLWECEPRFLETSGHEGFAEYDRALHVLLHACQFRKPFQLSEDPRQQDRWTT
ncbi:hypothetical protein AYL99_09751 [Fonsecaea erecta]|uniref:Uncharacterized protein n=1 Tax=Fonsecaea erecta TaxID=1367422 RepID=A0A178Z749_9EURO|nr:hypothetical protein AYL99_09751 [Fonsecaea erecta]OAP55600.1 hypothetical protein AYL99_09751 [Fonsecaea erecta]